MSAASLGPGSPVRRAKWPEEIIVSCFSCFLQVFIEKKIFSQGHRGEGGSSSGRLLLPHPPLCPVLCAQTVTPVVAPKSKTFSFTIMPLAVGTKRTSIKARKTSTGKKKKVRVLKRLAAPRAESKFHDVTIIIPLAPFASFILTPLLTIPQGTIESERIGRKITITSVHMYATLTLNPNTNLQTSSELYRVIMFQDKQANGAMPVVLDLMEANNVQSFRNLANSGRFIFLYDEFHTMNANAGAGNGTSNTSLNMFSPHIEFHKECNIPIEYDNQETTGLIATIRSNNIGILLMTFTGDLGGFDTRLRFRFSDG